MRSLKYVVYREGKYFVSQCLNVDISSFGKTIAEAVVNLKDVVPDLSKLDVEKYPIKRDLFQGIQLVGFTGLPPSRGRRRFDFPKSPNVANGECPMMLYLTLDNAEDGWIVAGCPTLPGCVSQGKNGRGDREYQGSYSCLVVG